MENRILDEFADFDVLFEFSKQEQETDEMEV